VNAGVAIHSLRAAEPAAMRRVVDGVGDVPIHIHVAEQTAEVDDCLAATGQRPIEWLCAQHALDARWQLVHATHATPYMRSRQLQKSSCSPLRVSARPAKAR
jgi:formimidoylglutamate deiminase